MQETTTYFKQQILFCRSYDELKILRELAVYYLKLERGDDQTGKKEPQQQTEPEGDPEDIEGSESDLSETQAQTYASTLQSWFPLWGGWYADKDASLAAMDFDQVIFF